MANTHDGARFRQVLRGYDKAEVDASVARLERQLAERTAERDSARLEAQAASEVAAQTPPERAWDEYGDRIAELLRSAEETGAAEIARAERVAAETIADAQQRVTSIEAEASGRVDEALEERRHRAEARAVEIVAEATAHAERLTAEARAQVEALEAKALALEVRRDELEGELAELRAEITHREPAVAEAVDRLETTGTTPDEVGPQQAPEWASAVRIIPPADDAEPEPDVPAEPVEALEVMEEVRRLHEEPSESPQVDDELEDPPADETEDEADVEPEPTPRPALTVVPDSHEGEAEPDDADVAVPTEDPTEEAADAPEADAPEVEAPVEDTLVAPEAASDEETSDGTVDEPATLPSADGSLDDLFASLRGEPEPAEPGPARVEPPERDEPLLRQPLELPDHTPILLPITNRALRVLKRQLADIQNIALEGLRLDPDGWGPSRADLSEPLTPVLHDVRIDAYRAGGDVIATEFDSDLDVTGSPSTNGSAMAGDLAASLERALVRGTDGPSRAAEVSRVFRSWRSDGAERHLRMEAIRAFHEGVRSAASTLGFEVAVVLGRPCPTCAEVVEGDNDLLPPIHDGCRCTVVVTP